MGDDTWCEEEFEQEEEDDEEEEGESEDEEEEDNETADEEDEEDSSGQEQEEEEQEEDEPAPPSRKPVHAAKPTRAQRAERAAAMSHRQPGADPNALVVELDENAIARHLLEVFDFGPHPTK